MREHTKDLTAAVADEPPNDPKPLKVFGVPVTLESVVKFAALIFSLGVLFNRLSTLEDRLTERINSKAAVIEIKMDNFDWRLQRVERNIEYPPNKR